MFKKKQETKVTELGIKQFLNFYELGWEDSLAALDAIINKQSNQVIKNILSNLYKDLEVFKEAKIKKVSSKDFFNDDTK